MDVSGNFCDEAIFFEMRERSKASFVKKIFLAELLGISIYLKYCKNFVSVINSENDVKK